MKRVGWGKIEMEENTRSSHGGPTEAREVQVDIRNKVKLRLMKWSCHEAC